jgi:hypothetical protein
MVRFGFSGVIVCQYFDWKNLIFLRLIINAGYYQCGRWTDVQLVSLVVKDWTYLRDSQRSIMSGINSMHPQKEPQSLYSTAEHKCHVLSAPNFSTFISTGAPTRMPILGTSTNPVGDVGSDKGLGTDSIFNNQ